MNLTELLDRNVTSPIPRVRECAMAIRGFADASVPDATMHDQLRAFGVSEKDIAWEISAGSKLRDLWAQSRYSRAMQVPQRAAAAPVVAPKAAVPVAAPRVAPAAAAAPAIANRNTGQFAQYRSPAETAARISAITGSVFANGLEPLATALVTSTCSVDQAIGALRAARADARMDPERDITADAYAHVRAERARARGEAPAPTPTLNTAGSFDPYAFRKQQVDAERARHNPTSRAPSAPTTGQTIPNPAAIYAARAAACQRARNCR
jgi:hypothetical protein